MMMENGNIKVARRDPYRVQRILKREFEDYYGKSRSIVCRVLSGLDLRTVSGVVEAVRIMDARFGVDEFEAGEE